MTTEKRGRFIINIGYWAIILAIVFVMFKYLLPLIMPFFLALIFSALLRPVVKFLNERCRVRQNIAALFCVFLFYIIIGIIIIALGARIVSTVSRLVSALPELYTSTVEPGLQQLFNRLEELGASFSPEVMSLLDRVSESLLSSVGGMVTGISSGVITWLSSIAGKLPGTILSTVICIIATVFLSIDFPRLTAFLMRQLPEQAKSFTRSVKHAIVSVVFRYGRSYLLIMLLTFAELAIGLLLIGVKAAIPMAVLIALVDIFPVVGSGLFLWPWAAILFIQGKTGMGLGMVALYIVITCVRQVAEPKIVGGHVGLHPLVTLMCMFIGTSLFGGIGLFGLPILAAVVKNLDDGGVIHLFKREQPSDDEPPDVDSPDDASADSHDDSLTDNEK